MDEVLNREKEDRMVSSALQNASKDTTVAVLYARWTLDCVVDTATAVAHDYLKRYRQYRDVSSELANVLANMRSRTGFDPQWPNAAQRSLIYTPLLGPSDAKVSAGPTSPFRAVAMAVRSSAIAYSERVYDTGEPMLRRAFVDASRNFRAYLTTLTGSVVERARHDTEPFFTQSTSVLTDEGVAQAFGLPPGPEGWPLPKSFEGPATYLSGDGAFLVEEITRLLASPGGAVTQQQFLMLQRAAVAGARTIQMILAAEHDAAEDKLRALIGEAYTWAAALRDLGTDGSKGK